MNPGPAPSPQPQPPIRCRRKPLNSWVITWIFQREESGCYRALLANLIQTNIPGYQNFVIEEHILHHIKKEVTNFRKPLEVGLKLAIAMRHLAIGETYTSLRYNWLVGQTTKSKFVPVVCQTILAEFREEHLTCPTDPDDWKKVGS